ncbi:hypothetical protein SEVIR_3G273350v4 [Setaria viridis]
MSSSFSTGDLANNSLGNISGIRVPNRGVHAIVIICCHRSHHICDTIFISNIASNAIGSRSSICEVPVRTHHILDNGDGLSCIYSPAATSLIQAATMIVLWDLCGISIIFTSSSIVIDLLTINNPATANGSTLLVLLLIQPSPMCSLKIRTHWHQAAVVAKLKPQPCHHAKQLGVRVEACLTSLLSLLYGEAPST